MQEQFETRPLIALEKLRSLQQRDNILSCIRLSIHLGVFYWLILVIVRAHYSVLIMLLLSITLAWVWSGLFAPFHECTHETAFKDKAYNKLGVWLSGVPFAMAPAVYRTFHFEHHRYTQDVDKDPELMNDPRYLSWPTGLKNWLVMATGIGLINLKLAPLLGFALKPESNWKNFAKWVDRAPDRCALVRECRLVLALWVVFIVACVFWVPNGGWLLFAAWFTHFFQTLWVASEHTGLPTDGSILNRTRTVTSNPFVRFWLWNMNYHAEHHAWPSIPWHRLPDAHLAVSEQLDSRVPGYHLLHRNIIKAQHLPSCDP